MKIKKQHRKKKYQFKLNRKRMHIKLKSTGKVACETIKEAWDARKSTSKNLRDMGLANDPNKAIKIPCHKKAMVKLAKKHARGDDSDSDEDKPVRLNPKRQVAAKLEQEAKAPRKRRFSLPKGQVEYITYLLDKYGHDYKAMAKDKKNYYQETWQQLRAKVKTFMGIPKQYAEYLQARGLLDKEEDPIEMKKLAKALTMEDSD